QTPQTRVDSIQSLETTPLTSATVSLAASKSAFPTPASAVRPGLLSSVASVAHVIGPTNITHYNIARTIDVQAGVDGADLGSVASGVQKLIDDVRPHLPRGSTIVLTGQPQALSAPLGALASGTAGDAARACLRLGWRFASS